MVIVKLHRQESAMMKLNTKHVYYQIISLAILVFKQKVNLNRETWRTSGWRILSESRSNSGSQPSPPYDYTSTNTTYALVLLVYSASLKMTSPETLVEVMLLNESFYSYAKSWISTMKNLWIPKIKIAPLTWWPSWRDANNIDLVMFSNGWHHLYTDGQDWVAW